MVNDDPIPMSPGHREPEDQAPATTPSDTSAQPSAAAPDQEPTPAEPAPSTATAQAATTQAGTTQAGTTDETLVLDARGIVKEFPGVRALDGVDLQVRPGEVHCLLGQNGAGKSTLIKVLSGAHQPDAGELYWRGEPVHFPNPISALHAGIATIYQELDVVDGLTVTENIFLGHEVARGGFTERRHARHQAAQLLQRLGHREIAPSAEVGRLSAAHKQIVSMARALSHDAQLIIMDEPSAVLDSEEVQNLFRVVRELTRSGIAVIYISHRLEEIRQIGDRITVLKDGATVASAISVPETDTDSLIRLMTGRSGAYLFPTRAGIPADAEILLEVADLSVAGVFSDVSFTVRTGEILGLAGLVGSGRSEIVETIYGARKATTGSVAIGGHRLRPGSVAAAVRAGIGLCPEERKSQGLILDDAIYQNISLPTFASLAKGGFLDNPAEVELARKQISDLDVRPANPYRTARTLSGGNQQKVVLGRWLAHGCRLLILDEPTRGVDVGARAEVYELIQRLSAQGVAIIVISSEIDEVIGLSDTVLVVSEGRIVHRSPATDITEEGVLSLVMEGSAA